MNEVNIRVNRGRHRLDTFRSGRIIEECPAARHVILFPHSSHLSKYILCPRPLRLFPFNTHSILIQVQANFVARPDYFCTCLSFIKSSQNLFVSYSVHSFYHFLSSPHTYTHTHTHPQNFKPFRVLFSQTPHPLSSMRCYNPYKTLH